MRLAPVVLYFSVALIGCDGGPSAQASADIVPNATGTPQNGENTQGRQNPLNASGRTPSPCPAGTVPLPIGPEATDGVIEILWPIPDTDGREPQVLRAAPVACLLASRLGRAARESGMGSSEPMALPVTWDPAGAGGAHRSQYLYSVLMCDELPDTPLPPTDLKIGEARWLATNPDSLKVVWYDDFRAKQERECG